MRCTACHGPVVFERTVFHETTPSTVRLCASCADGIDAIGHMRAIAAAPDHAAKTAAVDALLEAVRACEMEHAAPGE